ncbi:MAG: AAA family ATPase [bacterium]|nr:AAA family ATPase [bacterium]
MTDRIIKRIPYGVASYENIVRRNYYFVDKTMYLKALEDAGDYLFYIRPHGKSLNS